MVECFFRHITIEGLRRGVPELIGAIKKYHLHGNDLMPLVWTASAGDIPNKAGVDFFHPVWLQ